MTPERLTQFRNDGLVFDVADEGPLRGEAVVLLHGFPERAASWRGLIPELTGAGYRVLAPDQRGYSPGARPKGARHYRVDRLAGDVLALADQARAETFHVVGHDWGAAVVWQLAGAHGDRVRTATALSAPHPRAFLAAMLRGQLVKSWYILFFQLPWLPELLVRGDGRWRQAFERSACFASEEQAGAVAELTRQPGAATAIVNWYRALRFGSDGLRLPARAVRPTLFVWSDGDKYISRAGADLTGRYVEAPYRYEVFPGVSHWILEERPKETAELVLAHLAEHAGAGRPPLSG